MTQQEIEAPSMEARSVTAVWREIRRRLEQTRASLSEEIRAYPAPIPACDVQFNHLLEERRSLSRELERLDVDLSSGSLLEDGPEAIERFLGTSSWFDEATQQQIRDLIP